MVEPAGARCECEVLRGHKECEVEYDLVLRVEQKRVYAECVAVLARLVVWRLEGASKKLYLVED